MRCLFGVGGRSAWVGSASPSVRGLAAGIVLLSAFGPAVAELRAQLPEPDSVVPLEEIEVNVLRTPISLGQAPFSISVLGESALTHGKAGLSIEEALQGLPGVQVQNRYNSAVGERISIRGFGARSQFGVRGVTVLVDGIPATLPDGQSTLDHLDLGTLGRVEALRGPGSSTYGNGAGGVLRFETRRASGLPYRQEVRGVLGSDGMNRLQATGGGSYERSEYVVSLSRFEFDGFRRDPVADDGSTYGRARRLHLNGQVRTPVAGGELIATANIADLDGENPGSINDSLLAVGDRRAHTGNLFQRTNKQVIQGQVGVGWTGPAGDVEAELAAWGLFRNLDNPIPPAVIDLGRKAAGFRSVARGGTALEWAEELTWSFGGEIALQRDSRENFDNDGGERGPLVLDQFEKVRTVAVFGQADLQLSQRARVVGGMRYDRLNFSVDDRLDGGPDDSGSRVMDAVSPSVGVHVSASPDVGVFANVGTSFESPTTTELANRPSGAGGFNADLEPQRSVGVELGTRGVVGRQVAFEATVFQTNVTNELVPFDVPDIDRTFFTNAGSSTRRGFEAAVTVAPGGGATFRANYSLTDASFDDYVGDGGDFSGNDIPGLAPHRLESIVTLRRPGWFGEVRTVYVSAVTVSDRKTEACGAVGRPAQCSADSYRLVDLRAGLHTVRFAAIDLSPVAGITNLFNTLYAASVTVNAFGGRYFEPGPGRSVYVGLTAGFPGN